MHNDQRHSVSVVNEPGWFDAWREQIINPSLTALLALELCAIFLAAPLAAKGLPIARPVADALVLAVLVIVVVLSQRWGAITLILLGLAAIGVGFLPGGGLSRLSIAVLRRCGDILAFSGLIWVVGHVVYAPGRITFHRLQAAVMLYLTVAMIFASAYGLIWELNPAAFGNLVAPVGGPEEVANMMYFSLTTLTSTGYGDIVAVDPFARSLANLEAIIAQFYLAMTIARLVTLHLEDRPR